MKKTGLGKGLDALFTDNSLLSTENENNMNEADEKIYKIYVGITNLKHEFPYLSNEEIKEKIEEMQSDFLDVYNNKEDGDADGNNENMGN